MHYFDSAVFRYESFRESTPIKEKRMSKFSHFFPVAFLSLTFLLIGCAVTPQLMGKKVDHENIVDGIYKGNCKSWPVKVAVQVNIENQKITKIDLLSHRAWKGKKAEKIILNRIIEEQSTRVDAVSGATVSSFVLMNAVQNAMDNAIK